MKKTIKKIQELCAHDPEMILQYRKDGEPQLKEQCRICHKYFRFVTLTNDLRIKYNIPLPVLPNGPGIVKNY